MQSSPRKEKSKRKKIVKQKVKTYIFSTEYIFLNPKTKQMNMNKKKQMNHKNNVA